MLNKMLNKIDVLDKGFVRLVDFMGSDLSVVNAARVSYGKESKELSAKDEKLIDYLYSQGHNSPFGHATVQLHIKAPIFVLRQWMKHGVGCRWNEQSGRYVVFQAEVYRPEIFRKQSKVNKQGSQGVIEEQDNALLEYDHAINTSILTYNKLIEAGVAREQARSILPLGLYTEAWWTASLEAVMHFLKQREDSHAQKEIQEYAKVVRALLTPLFEKSLSHAK